MKILHLQTELNITCGITKTIFLIAKNSSSKFDHCIFTLGGDNLKAFADNGIIVYQLGKNRNSFWGSVKIFYYLFKLCKKEKINILHAHHRYFDLIAYLLRKFINVKVITSVHSKVYGKRSFSYKADKLIAVSQSIRKHLMKQFHIDEQRILVINNFVEIPFPVNEKYLQADFQLPSGYKIALFVGRFSKEKGIDILLRAIHKLQSNGEKIFLLLIGNGEEKNFVENYIARNNIAASALPPKTDITQYFFLSSVIILPSRVDPFPLIMLEAGACSKPFIGSNVDGIAECIENNINGILVSLENVDELSNAIVYLINNKEIAERLGKKLFEKVVLNYSVANTLPLYENSYNNLLNVQS